MTGATEGPYLLRQGNLAEIWAIHNFADDESKNRIMPKEIDNNVALSLIEKDVESNKRRYHVRVPLFKPDICIGVDPVIGDADCVIDWNGIFGKQNFKNVPGGSDSTFSSKLSTYVFRVPTEPTALEFSFMIDYPRMAWRARNPNNVSKSDYKNGAVITYGEKPDIDAIDIDPDNFTKWVEEIQDEATYFDAVYWVQSLINLYKKKEIQLLIHLLHQTQQIFSAVLA